MPLPGNSCSRLPLAALTTLPLLVVGNIPTLAVVLFCGGVSISPTSSPPWA